MYQLGINKYLPTDKIEEKNKMICHNASLGHIVCKLKPFEIRI